MTRLRDRRRASALVLVLSMLAMLSVIATTFVLMMKLDVRVTSNYVDDERCDLLAYGVVNYFKGVVRDDLDHTWRAPWAFKHANRITGVGYYSKEYSNTATPNRQIPGIVEYKWGTPVANCFWFSAPWSNWDSGASNIYGGGNYSYWDVCQQSFAWNDHYGTCWGLIGRYSDDPAYECDVWIGMANNAKDQSGRHCANNYILGGGLNPVDDDGDGVTNPNYDSTTYGPFYNENHVVFDSLYDTAPLVMQSGPTGFQPGTRLTGENGLPGGLYWTWGAKIGPTHSTYVNLNTAGNMDGIDPQWLANMGVGSNNRVVAALRAPDEAADTVVDGNPNAHLGRIEWSGFPPFYDAVMFHPSAVNLERLFHRPAYDCATGGGGVVGGIGLSRELARQLIRYRMTGDVNFAGIPVPGGGAQFRAGWRRDGATYFKFPSPENPLGHERYFGSPEIIEHSHTEQNPSTSAVASILGKDNWRTLRPYATMWSTDTILRGKIFPTEGGPGMGGYTSAVGDWRHINILKRVNINIIGADGASLGLPNEQTALKSRWSAKRQSEADRLFWMLKGALNWAGIDNTMPACQFIASLSDMVDSDASPTTYIAPDGSGCWGVGYERHPFINEVAFYTNNNADKTDYDLFRLRVELYNPFELIPWYPAADQAIDLSQFVLEISNDNVTHNHVYPLSKLHRLGNDWWDAGQIGTGSNRWLFTDGLYGVPVPGFYLTGPAQPDVSWDRYVQVAWIGAGGSTGEFPGDIDRTTLQGGPAPTSKPAQFDGVSFSLWRLVTVPSAVPDTPYLVTNLGGLGGRFLKVDTTNNIKLVRPWDPSKGETGPGTIDCDTDFMSAGKALTRNKNYYTGVYRRWDPTNGKIYAPNLANGHSGYGRHDQCNVLWCPGWALSRATTLGRPNTEYWPNMYSTDDPGTVGAPASAAAGTYRRCFERPLKVVDGDLPSIGWVGELIMWNVAARGPLSQIHASGQNPTLNINAGGSNSRSVSANQIETLAKFDLFRPFTPAGKYDPDTTGMPAIKLLHVLDMLTVWDPSNDGIDNDGDGAVDDEDTGLQAGDRYGPEVRIHGQIDINQVPDAVWAAVWPDGAAVRNARKQGDGITGMSSKRQKPRVYTGSQNDGIGPFETIGDLLRADCATRAPGCYLTGYWYVNGPGALDETGITTGDDDGDGIYNSRSERDMFFLWMSNYLTTRDNVFDMDLYVQVSAPPHYPTDRNGNAVRVAWPAYKSGRVYAHKQFLGILDRSTCLRIRPGGRCDFTGPVDLRLFRSSEDVPVY